MDDKILIANDKDCEILNQYIIDYNLSKVPFPKNPPWESINYVIKKDNTIVAGITSALIMNNILSIDVLFVSEKYRIQKYGSLLLEKVENEAKNKGAYLVQLDTFEFQALGFYQKHCYEIFGILEDCPSKGHKRYYLKKNL
ncbi:MAG: GNAT family N-acetyltransferase [Alphaproteobacteria bacterium]